MNREPCHPGMAFKVLVIDSSGLTIKETAEKIGVSRKSLSEVINERSSLSIGMAKRFARYTNTTIESWYKM